MKTAAKAAAWLALAGLVALPGCWWRKKAPANAFPGTKWYDQRAADMEISPEQAFDLAYRHAEADGRPQYMSNRPQVIYGRQYVFSMPVAEGANLHGYHVDGDTGRVRFYKQDKIITP